MIDDAGRRLIFIDGHDPDAAPRDNTVTSRNPIQLPQATIARTSGQRGMGGELPTGTDGSLQSIARREGDTASFPTGASSLLTNGSAILVFQYRECSLFSTAPANRVIGL